MTLYRYSRWDGTQDLFPISEDDLLDQPSDQIMAHGDLSAALRSVIWHGASGKSGQRLPIASRRYQGITQLQYPKACGMISYSAAVNTLLISFDKLMMSGVIRETGVLLLRSW